MNYTAGQFKARYTAMTNACTVQITLETDLVSGMSASEEGIRAFVTNHLHLVGEDAENAIKRIMAEEISVTPEAGEIEEKLTYGLYVFRHDEVGPWLGDWMIKACLKAAASRLGLFVSKRGSKGDVSEMGRVRSIGASLADPNPERVHIVQQDGTPAESYYREFKGRVSTPKGSMSIVSHRECIKAGASLHFEFRWYKESKLKKDNILDIFAAAANIGLGSAKNYESGKFRIDALGMEE